MAPRKAETTARSFWEMPRSLHLQRVAANPFRPTVCSALWHLQRRLTAVQVQLCLTRYHHGPEGRKGGARGRGSSTQPSSPALRAALPPPPPGSLAEALTWEAFHQREVTVKTSSPGPEVGAARPPGATRLPLRRVGHRACASAHPPALWTLLSRALWGWLRSAAEARQPGHHRRSCPLHRAVRGTQSVSKERGRKSQENPGCSESGVSGCRVPAPAMLRRGRGRTPGPPSKPLPATSRASRRAGNLGPRRSTRPRADARPLPLPLSQDTVIRLASGQRA